MHLFIIDTHKCNSKKSKNCALGVHCYEWTVNTLNTHEQLFFENENTLNV